MPLLSLDTTCGMTCVSTILCHVCMPRTLGQCHAHLLSVHLRAPGPNGSCDMDDHLIVDLSRSMDKVTFAVAQFLLFTIGKMRLQKAMLSCFCVVWH